MTTRSRILQTALTLFNEHGMYQTGVRDIARALDISPGNLSYHFARKEDLLIAILDQYKHGNDKIYQEYMQFEPDLERYLQTISRLLKNAFAHRGVFLGLDELRAIFGKEYDYADVERKRRAFIDTILSDLEKSGDLEFSTLDKSFLIDFLAFFQRCWIMEAMISYPHLEEHQIMTRYMRFVVMQFAQVATLKGQGALGRWL